MCVSLSAFKRQAFTSMVATSQQLIYVKTTLTQLWLCYLLYVHVLKNVVHVHHVHTCTVHVCTRDRGMSSAQTM